MKKERGIRAVEYGSPTKSSKQGIKTCRGEETVGKAEREQGGFFSFRTQRHRRCSEKACRGKEKEKRRMETGGNDMGIERAMACTKS